MQKEPLTPRGYEMFMDELNDLKKNQRPQIVVEIDIARSYGDLKENAEYHAAREKQRFIEARIAEMEEMQTRIQVIDPKELPHTRISFGSTVELTDLDTDEELVYTIVGSVESNPDKGLISYHSPLAKMLIGKEEGDDLKAQLPGGVKELEVESIYYKEIEF